MESLPPIPTPPAQRWREFRIQALPVMTFLLVLVCIAALWKNYIIPSNMVGEVEVTQASIISSVPGTLKELKVKRFQRVAAGDEIAVVSAMDTETVLASIRAIEGDLKLMRARMQLDVERNTQSYESIRLEYLKERTDAMYERVNAQWLANEARRQEQLLTNTPALTTQTDYDEAVRLAAAAATNVIEKELYLAEKEKTLPKLVPATKADEAILDAIKGQEELLRAEGQNISLKAPIDGMVSMVNLFPNGKVVPNLPIVVITSTDSSRIIAYVRRPYSTIPKPGDTVQIVRHNFKREVADGTVLEVAGHLSPISAGLIPIATGASTNELGLPFAVSIPPQLALLPGEAVDLILRK